MADNYLVFNTDTLAGLNPYDLYLPHVRCMECNGLIGTDKISGTFMNRLQQGFSEAEAIDEVAKVRFPEFWVKTQEQLTLARNNLEHELPTSEEIVKAGLEEDMDNVTLDKMGMYYFRRLYHQQFKDCCIRYIRRPMTIQVGKWLGVERTSSYKARQIEQEARREKNLIAGGLNDVTRPRGRMYKITRDRKRESFLPGMKIDRERVKLPELPTLDMASIPEVESSIEDSDTLLALQQFRPSINPMQDFNFEDPGFDFETNMVVEEAVTVPGINPTQPPATPPNLNFIPDLFNQ